ncbi:MAG: VWA domain-containing protein [Candidatus Sulfotelmatobacter sp.]|jgi:VWFA-related protein
MGKAHIQHIVGVLFILAILVGFAPASGRQSSPPSGPAQSPGEDQDQSLETLKVNVNVVQLFFNAKDKKGALVYNLTKDDFEILEDGKPQNIKYFAAESNLPLTLGILIDSSGSQERVLHMEKKVGGEFLNEILRDQDLAFVIGFDVNVNLLQDFTNSVDVLQTALNSARIDITGGRATGTPGPGGTVPVVLRGTLLYDAVYLASNDELSQQVGRKAMILLTDGEDQGSQMRITDAIEAAQRSGSIIYVLLCADRSFYGSGEYSGKGKMKKLTEATGGRVIVVGNKLDKLKDAFRQIAGELCNQYNIGYTPTNTALDGTFRKVEIHVKGKDYRIQARTGYYAVPTRN